MLRCWGILTHTRGALFKTKSTLPEQFQYRYISLRQTFRMSSTAADSPNWTAQKVRSTFLEYFEGRGHTFGKSFLTMRIFILMAI